MYSLNTRYFLKITRSIKSNQRKSDTNKTKYIRIISYNHSRTTIPAIRSYFTKLLFHRNSLSNLHKPNDLPLSPTKTSHRVSR